MLGVIRHFEELEKIRGEWMQLCSDSPAATVFQTPEWLLSWWRHLGGGELLVLTWREAGRLRGLAPLYIHGMPGQSIRQISFIGTGITDYLDFVVMPGYGEAFARAVGGYLEETGSSWDVVNLEELRPGAAALHLAGESQPISSCAVIQLPASKDQFYTGLGAVHRRNVRHALKQMRSAGAFRHEIAGAGRFDSFARLHAASWRDRGETGVLQTEALQSFYRESAEAFERTGALRLHLLFLDEEPAGAILAYHYRARGYAYLGGFDPAIKKLSPGTALMALAIERAIEEGLKEWDLLRGEESYKLLWGAESFHNRKLTYQKN